MKKYTVEAAGRSITVETEGEKVLLEGKAVTAVLGGVRGQVKRRLALAGRTREVVVQQGTMRGQWRLMAGGHRFEVQVLDERDRVMRDAGGGFGRSSAGVLKAPMPGLVVRVLVGEGEKVEAGTGLVVVEAMKMENELKAAAAGTVKTIHVEPGDRVEKGAALVELG